MTGGDFSVDAYQALRDAYANQLSSQEDIEQAGVQVMGQRMTMETLPVDSPWRDKIESWTYPTGKSAYTDGPQKSPEEVLQLMRDAAAERDARAEMEDPDPEDMSDEELRAYVDQLLAEEDGEVDEDKGEDGENGESDDDEEISDEEIDALISELLDGVDDDFLDDEEEEPTEVEEEAEAEYDPEAIQAELESLRQELDAMRFTPDE